MEQPICRTCNKNQCAKKDKNSDCYNCSPENCSFCLHRFYWNQCDSCFKKEIEDDEDKDTETP